MVTEMVMDMVNSCESASVVAGIIESILYNSYVEGEANVVWSKMEANNDIKKRRDEDAGRGRGDKDAPGGSSKG